MIGWIFSIGGILGFFTMLAHSLMFHDNKRTIFVFGGGSITAYLLEYTLSEIYNQYSYQNVPITLFNVPLVIPAGWVVTFYGLLSIAEDLTKKQTKQIALTGILGLLWGFGIEILARNSDFWVFHVNFILIYGIPIVAILAWGFSTANFATGILLFDKYNSKRWHFPIILLIIHIINLLIAYVLSQFYA